MKHLIVTLCFVFASVILFAQKSGESNFKFIDGDASGVTISLEGQAKNVEEVMEQKFKSVKGGKNEKGWRSYKGAVFSAISNDMLDIYYKVDKEGDNKTKIYVVLSKGYNNYLTSKENSSEINNVKKMLDEMVTEVRRYELGLAIDAQTKVFEKATKEQEKLVKDGEDLVKDKEKLEKELAENKQDTEDNKKAQEEQKKVVEAEKKTLGDLQKKLSEVK